MRDESWLIVDTETDGLCEPVHAVEIAAQKMRGWERDGDPFRILLNHDVPIDPAAEALHGYSRDYLRRHGTDPLTAHAKWREYAGDLPVVAYNISFDWNRVLEPEYARVGVPIAGRRGFCAMTLARRVIVGTDNFKLETLKEHFGLNIARSHQGRNDVETLVSLFERVIATKLYNAGVIGFEAIADFSRKTPVARCQEHINGVGDPVWYFLDSLNNAQGPFPPSTIRQLAKEGPVFTWREGMSDWTLTSELPDFAEPTKGRRKRATPKITATDCDGQAEQPNIEVANRARPRTVKKKEGTSLALSVAQAQWANELIGLCRGILADGEINTQELVTLQRWLEECPVIDLYPISVVAELVEYITADGVVTSEELMQLKQALALLLPV